MAEAHEQGEIRAGESKDRLNGATQVNMPSALSNAAREQWLAPSAGVQHFIPRDDEVETRLIEIEKLIRHRNYNAAIRLAGKVELGNADFAATYALLVQEKVARASVALGDRYLAQGERERAVASYRAALEAKADPASGAVTALAAGAVSELVKLRSSLIDQLGAMLVDQKYDAWCPTRARLKGASILDHLKDLAPDVRLVDALGPRMPPGWPPQENPQSG